MRTAVILGAGYSSLAGLPLAAHLLDDHFYITSRGAERRFDAVLAAWKDFRAGHPAAWPELFLTELYRNASAHGIRWQWAVELVAATLASPRGRDVPVVRNIRYSGRLTKEVQSTALVQFWDIVCRADLQGIVTTNYDLLAERGLRHRALKRRPRPGFHYGGFSKPQRLKGLAQPWTVLDAQRIIVLDSGVPIYKLHGSLNWSNEGGDLLMYQDMRPAFRRGADALIIPPMTEKETPEWLSAVWAGASSCLSRCERWIVCGYSLPPYDIALQELFGRSSSTAREICVVDPLAALLTGRWQQAAPTARIFNFDGLPQGLQALDEHLRSEVS